MENVTIPFKLDEGGNLFFGGQVNQNLLKDLREKA